MANWRIQEVELGHGRQADVAKTVFVMKNLGVWEVGNSWPVTLRDGQAFRSYEIEVQDLQQNLSDETTSEEKKQPPQVVESTLG